MAWGSVALLWLGSCRAPLPTPALGSHEGDVPVVVPYPPGPAQVELVGEQPEPGAVWVDGSWAWTGQAYVWQAGSWQTPAPGASYARPELVRRANGELVYFPGRWHEPPPAAGLPAPSASTGVAGGGP